MKELQPAINTLNEMLDVIEPMLQGINTKTDVQSGTCQNGDSAKFTKTIEDTAKGVSGAYQDRILSISSKYAYNNYLKNNPNFSII